MTIIPVVSVTAYRSGMAAHALALQLTCHGRTMESAVAALNIVLGDWARALAREGSLREVLDRRGVQWDGDDDEISVRPIVTNVTS